MGRSPCCDESGLKKGPWTTEEDDILVKYIQRHGHGSWRALPKLAGLNRCGKSCRLRWTNYLRPDIKRGKFSPEEEQTILNLHAILGNKWSAIASHLPGRTDNEIKNFWNTHLKKKLIQMGFDPMTHQPRTDLFSSLPQLLALATLKDLVVDHHHSIEERAARLQAEAAIAKLQYLQLLQTPSNYDLSLLAATANNASNNHTNAHLNSFMDIETLKLLASLVQSPENPILPVGPGPNNITTPLHQNFGSPHLPEMQQQNNSSCSFQEQTTVKEIDSNTVFHVEASDLNGVLNQELNTPSSPWQLPPLSSTDALISNQSLDESSNWNYDWSNSILEDSFISETDRP